MVLEGREFYDLHGNVWEWGMDGYVGTLLGGDNPLHTSSAPYRVVRGGGWFNGARNLRSGSRDYGSPEDGDYGVGFRLVRTR